MAYTQKASSSQATVDALNELLRGELSAVESYDKAILALGDEPNVSGNLRECRASHEARADRLSRAILQVGGEPARAPGAWGPFAKVIAGGARTLAWETVIRTLEQGEDHGLKDYKDALPRLDLGLQRLVSSELYPQQVHTHGVLSALKRGLAA
jgi:hypothetical protein